MNCSDFPSEKNIPKRSVVENSTVFFPVLFSPRLSIWMHLTLRQRSSLFPSQEEVLSEKLVMANVSAKIPIAFSPSIQSKRIFSLFDLPNTLATLRYARPAHTLPKSQYSPHLGERLIIAANAISCSCNQDFMAWPFPNQDW